MIGKEEVVNLNTDLSGIITPTIAKISPLNTDFGTQDLNDLRDKVNEIIKSR